MNDVDVAKGRDESPVDAVKEEAHQVDQAGESGVVLLDGDDREEDDVDDGPD